MCSYGIQLLLKQKTAQHSRHAQIRQKGKKSWKELLTNHKTITQYTAYIRNLDNLFRSSDNIMYPTGDCSLISAIFNKLKNNVIIVKSVLLQEHPMCNSSQLCCTEADSFPAMNY